MHTMSKRYVIAVCAILLAVGGVLLFTSRGLSRSRATQIAEGELASYCAGERLPRGTFQLQEATEDDAHRWAFDFASTSTSKHAVRIYVTRNGRTETHRMKDE